MTWQGLRTIVNKQASLDFAAMCSGSFSKTHDASSSSCEDVVQLSGYHIGRSTECSSSEVEVVRWRRCSSKGRCGRWLMLILETRSDRYLYERTPKPQVLRA